MRTVALSILLAAGAALAGVADAQAPPGAPPQAVSLPPAPNPGLSPNGWDGDSWRGSNILGTISRSNSIEYGVSALKARKYAEAEGIFANVLQDKPTNADANFYMGVAKMNLGKWSEAKKYLEFAVTRKPEHPDPKSRLGVTYAKLGDTAGAITQRADLVKMGDSCSDGCKLSPYIRDGIQMIDKALAQPTAPSQG